MVSHYGTITCYLRVADEPFAAHSEQQMAPAGPHGLSQRSLVEVVTAHNVFVTSHATKPGKITNIQAAKSQQVDII